MTDEVVVVDVVVPTPIVVDVVVPTPPVLTVDVGIPGPQGPQGIPGPIGGFYHHVQGVPAATWRIVHGLGFEPSVTVADSTGAVVIGAVTYLDANTVEVDFASAFGGDAYLS